MVFKIVSWRRKWTRRVQMKKRDNPISGTCYDVIVNKLAEVDTKLGNAMKG